jgi:hypothetical protein
MQCDRLREAISARIDGEDPGLLDWALDAHLGVCAGCRAWQQRADAVTRRARLGGLFLDHDLTPKVIAAARPWSSWDEAGNGLIEPTGADFLDEGEKLVRAHLDPLPEVIGDHDPPVLGTTPGI